jgi:hypothetical protein
MQAMGMYCTSCVKKFLTQGDIGIYNLYLRSEPAWLRCVYYITLDTSWLSMMSERED